MQSEIRKIIGYDAETTLLNEKGREYLKVATNPDSILAIKGTLIVASDNETLSESCIEHIESLVKNSFINYSKVRENDEVKS